MGFEAQEQFVISDTGSPAWFKIIILKTR
jgi:hypothetical protein